MVSTKVDRKTGEFQKRIVVLTVFFIVAFVLIVFRLAYVQLVKGASYSEQASRQRLDQVVLEPVRGDIKISDIFNGQTYTVATTNKEVLAYANASEIDNDQVFAEKVAQILSIPAESVRSKISEHTKKYIVLKKKLTDAEQNSLNEAKLKGLHYDYETSRLYPEGDFLGALLGFVGYKDDKKVGVYGLEQAYQDQLAGTPGRLLQESDNTGRWIFGSTRDQTPAKDGDSLILTIDKTIQLQAEEVIKSAVKENQADSGSIVIMDPKTGAILAMANAPGFNPNEYSKTKDVSEFNNQTTVGSYEPGSIFKPLTMAAAINEGKITSNTTFNDTGSIEVDGFVIKNSDEKAHGIQTMSQVLEESLNTGTIFAKNSIGNKKFAEYVKRFGFGKKTGMEVAESSGNLSALDGNVTINYHTASFGQAISVTPIQMVQAFSALANGGKMVKPYVIKETVSPKGKIEVVGKPQFTDVVTAKTASEVSAMLVNVVEKGHGKKAAVKGYYVAGKTGTAQVPRKDGKGYQENVNIGSFIGYAPVEDPKFVMLVRVDHPRTVKFAETTAAPAFGKMAAFLLQYYKVSPTRPTQ